MRGGGELASAAARLLFLTGYRVVALERERPLAVRRLVCFAEAIPCGEASVEGVRGERVPAERVQGALQARQAIPVVVDPAGRLLATLRPEVVVDGRMAKTSLGTQRSDAPLVIGLGPGFAAGGDVHAVIETQRGPDLGRVIWSGAAEADSGRPAPVAGVAEERVLRAPRDGTFTGRARIGDLVPAGATLGAVGGEPVVARSAGLLRGLIADGVEVTRGMKLGDVDPRGNAVDPARISDKARAVAAGVLEAVTVGLARLAAAALLVGALPAWSEQKPPALPLEHQHPSGAFTFRTPAGWTARMLEDQTDVFEARGDGLLVRYYWKAQEIGLDSLHASCMDMRLLGPMETSPRVRYEHDFIGGVLGERRVLDSAFEVRYDREVAGAFEWRQRNVTIVGEGQSLCAISHAPRPRWKKSETRALLDAVLGSIAFR